MRASEAASLCSGTTIETPGLAPKFRVPALAARVPAADLGSLIALTNWPVPLPPIYSANIWRCRAAVVAAIAGAGGWRRT